MADIPLILFAKAPIAGHVKTRLSTHCADQQCAEIAEILLETTVQKAVNYWPGRVLLSVALDYQHSFLRSLIKRYELELSLQVEGDLGVKMNASLAEFGYPASVMGCDVPHISGEILLQAFNYLKNGQEVIGPADDGGFYLIGANQSTASLFSTQKWGGSEVLGTTLTLAKSANRHLYQLSSLRDIDVWEDLLAASKIEPALERYLIQQGLT